MFSLFPLSLNARIETIMKCKNQAVLDKTEKGKLICWSYLKLIPERDIQSLINLKDYEIITVKYFCVHDKIRWEHNQHFKLLFFRINTLSGTSNWISTYEKLNLFLINSVYVVISSLEMQRRLVQTKLYYKSFYSTSKETSHKASKVAAVKNPLPSVYVIGTVWFHECVLFCFILYPCTKKQNALFI